MSATGWTAYRQLLLQVFREETGYRMMKRVTWLLLGGVLLIMAVSLYLNKSSPTKGLLALFLFVAVPMWGGIFLKNATAQNRPEYAVLVPQLRTRLMRLTTILLIASSLLLSVPIAWIFGAPGYALLAGGAMSLYILFISRYQWAGFFPALIALPLAKTGLADRLIPALHEDLGQAATSVLGCVMLLALGAWGLRQVFPQGGDAHWVWFKRLCRNKDAARAPAQAVPVTRLGEWWQAKRASRYQVSLRNDSRDGGTPQRMMMYALGPGAHPATYIASGVVNTMIALAVLAVAHGRVSASVFVVMGTVMQCSVLLILMMYVQGVVDGAIRYRTEQAIFFLSASAPAKAQVNRLLAGAMLRGFFMVWLAALVCVCCIDFVIQGEVGLRGISFMLAILLLPLACKLPRDYAVAQATDKSTSWIAVSVPYMIVCNVLLSLVNARYQLPWFWLAGVIAVVSLLVLCRRWRKLLALPPVLPAGRLAV
ncbi:hypothetical protein GTP44_04540 [Duganella sp. FT50W]|uniref:Uncharacterized protein n=1 Tax=Duganella lactea TaxID=2692173 RepID=A0A6L8MHK0_9BURK|nr:hypothetical protein [Duganella lactea]MYM81226.1 hypothetical protein [Duganella lactea]